MLMNLLSGSGRLIVGLNPNLFENLTTERVSIEEPGFVIVYVDNQTIGKDVWFDNVQVLHYNTKVMEEKLSARLPVLFHFHLSIVSISLDRPEPHDGFQEALI